MALEDYLAHKWITEEELVPANLSHRKSVISNLVRFNTNRKQLKGVASRSQTRAPSPSSARNLFWGRA